jgi:hypothetical protein
MFSTSNDTLPINLKAIYISNQPTPAWSLPASSPPAIFRIDSALPQIWLPLEACNAFELAFNLSWNSELELYLVPETAHTRLLQDNPSVSFSLGSGTGTDFKNITLSYMAFDLQLSPPLVEQRTYYFPIRRAKDPSQYLLGRAFLQGTYLTVDYRRHKFNLSETLFMSGGFGSVVPIFDTPASSDLDDKKLFEKNDRVLSTAAYAGIGISVAFFTILVAVFLLAWYRGLGPFRRLLAVTEKKDVISKEGSVHEAMENQRSELAAKKRVEAMGTEIRELESVEVRELEIGERRYEADGLDSPVEGTERHD